MVVDYDKETEGQYGLVAPQTKSLCKHILGLLQANKVKGPDRDNTIF